MSKFFFFKKKSSKDIAKDRLKILLISDRINCSPKTLSMIKADVISAISKYVNIDEEHTEIILKKNSKKGAGKRPTLYANIPIIDVHD